MKVAKASYRISPLNTVLGRTMFLTGLQTGAIPLTYIKPTMAMDNEARPYRKPVVVEDIRFDSITEAAEYLLKKEIRRYKVIDVPRKMDCLKHQITRWCNADNVEGYYWAE